MLIRGGSSERMQLRDECYTPQIKDAAPSPDLADAEDDAKVQKKRSLCDSGYACIPVRRVIYKRNYRLRSYQKKGYM